MKFYDIIGTVEVLWTFVSETIFELLATSKLWSTHFSVVRSQIIFISSMSCDVIVFQRKLSKSLVNIATIFSLLENILMETSVRLKVRYLALLNEWGDCDYSLLCKKVCLDIYCCHYKFRLVSLVYNTRTTLFESMFVWFFKFQILGCKPSFK